MGPPAFNLYSPTRSVREHPVVSQQRAVLNLAHVNRAKAKGPTRPVKSQKVVVNQIAFRASPQAAHNT